MTQTEFDLYLALINYMDEYHFYKYYRPEYDKYDIKYKEGESFVDTLVKSEITANELEELHIELSNLINTKGTINSCRWKKEMSESLRRIRDSAHGVPGIGFIDGQIKRIRTKTQYKKLDEAIVQAINIKKETER